MDKEYWQYYNPKNWGKDTWIGGLCVLAYMIIAYFIIVIFH